MNYSKEDFLKVLKKADAAGDAEAVAKLKEAYDNKWGAKRNEPQNLTSEELSARKAELEQSMEVTQAQMDEATLNSGIEKHQTEVMSSNFEAISKGAIQGATGLVDEAQAAYTSMIETAEDIGKAVQKQGMSGFDNILSTYGENFHRNRRMYQEELEQLKKDHPDAFSTAETAGSIAGSIGMGMLFPGSVVGSLAAMGTYGLFHGAASSEAETLGGRIQGGLAGGAREVAIGGAFGAAGKAVGGVARATSEVVSNSAFLSFMSKSLSKWKGKFGIREKVIDYSNRMVNYKNRDGSNVLRFGDDSLQVLDSINKSKEETFEEIVSMYGHIDEIAPMKYDDFAQVINTLKHDIVEPISRKGKFDAGDPVKKESQALVRRMFDETFFVNHPSAKIKLADGRVVPLRVPGNIDISRLNEIKRDFYSNAKKDHLGIGEFYEKAADRIGSIIDNHVSKNSHKISTNPTTASFLNDMGLTEAKAIGGELSEKQFYGVFKATNKKYRDMLNTSKLLDDKLNNTEGMVGLVDIFKNNISSMSLAATAAATLGGVSMEAAVLAAGGVLALSRSSAVNHAASLSLVKIANAFKANPDRYNKLAMKILVGSDVSSDTFHQRVMEAGAEVDLSENPLQRSFEDAMSRKDSLLTLTRLYEPYAYDELKKAIDEGNSEAVGAIVSGSNQLSKFLSPGMGWEGRAIAQKDKEAVANYIKGLAPRDRRQASLDFQKTQKIPVKMLTGEDPKKKEIEVLYKRARDKVRNPGL